MKEKLINWFKENFPIYYSDMENADHNYDDENLNAYHEEGSVMTHTGLVFDQYKGDDEITGLAMLLHDIGKPLALERNDETKRVSFLNHEALGIPRAYKVLKKYQEDFKTISDEDIINILIMIKHHLRIFQIKNPKKIEAVYRAFSDDKYIYNFIDLAQCDSRGRISNNGVKFLANKRPLLDLIGTRKPREGLNGNVNILIGMSGSGKSTYIKSIGEEDKTFSFDKERIKAFKQNGIVDIAGMDDSLLYSMAFDYCNDNKINIYNTTITQLIQCLNDENNVYYDNTNLTTKTRNKLFSQFTKEIRPVKTALVFIPDESIMHSINSDRPDKTIPKGVLISQLKAFQFPDYNEFDEIEIVRLMGNK